MIVRCEGPDDVRAIAAVHADAFAEPDDSEGPPVEVQLVTDLRASDSWIPQLSLVLEVDDAVVGHVVCTRGWIGEHEALGLGPIGLLKSHQRMGGGSALMHAVIGSAEALGEPVVALLGSTEYYPKFGFVSAADLSIDAPEAEWGLHFQARPLSAYSPDMIGKFKYAAPFDNL